MLVVPLLRIEIDCAEAGADIRDAYGYSLIQGLMYLSWTSAHILNLVNIDLILLVRRSPVDRSFPGIQPFSTCIRSKDLNFLSYVCCETGVSNKPIHIFHLSLPSPRPIQSLHKQQHSSNHLTPLIRFPSQQLTFIGVNRIKIQIRLPILVPYPPSPCHKPPFILSCPVKELPYQLCLAYFRGA